MNLFNSTLLKFGRVDALFANAGVYVPGDVAQGDPDEWAHMIDVNVNGVLRIVRAVLPHMLERGGGDIIVNSSVSGHQAIHWEPVYSASKHAQLTFSRSTAALLAPRGIHVHTVNPGFVETEGFPQRSTMSSALMRRVVIGPERVAAAVLTAIERNRRETTVPRWYRVAGLAQAIAPTLVSRVATRTGTSGRRNDL